MGWTKRDIVSAALEEVGLGDYAFDVDPRQVNGALRRLDSMMAMWNAKAIRLGYPLPSSPSNSDLDEESGLSDMHVQAAVLNLAIQIAPSFGKQVSFETKRAAREAYNAMLTNVAHKNTMQMPSSMPVGSGYKRRSGCQDRFFYEADPVQVGDDDLEV